jgi:hypothetical protein
LDELLNSTITELNVHAKNSSKSSYALGRNLEPMSDYMTDLAVGTVFEKIQLN